MSITLRDTVTAAGNYDLSAIMRVALEKARARHIHARKHGLTFADCLKDALKNTWAFARANRDTVRWTLAIVAERAAAAAPALMQEAA